MKVNYNTIVHTSWAAIIYIYDEQAKKYIVCVFIINN